MIRAIVFDLDGTLLNTLDDLCDSLNFAMDACQMPRHSLEKTRQMGGVVPTAFGGQKNKHHFSGYQ